MGLFKPKKIYCIQWKWDNSPVYSLNTSIVKARDMADAWKKFKKEHPMADYCHSILEITKEQYEQGYWEWTV